MKQKIILSYLLKAAQTLAWAHLLYFGGMCSAYIINYTSPPINSQSELEVLLKQERKKLEIPQEKIIHAKLESYNGSYAQKVAENEYEITLDNLSLENNLNVLRHELYHIADGHCEEGNSNFLLYLYWNEPQAVIYSLSDIKL